MEQQDQYAKAKWAETLGVSTSGYYDWLKDREQRQERDERVRRKIIELFHQEGEGTYGAALICGCMRRVGYKASYKVVKRIMAEEGLKSFHWLRRQRSLTDSRKARSDAYQNLTRDLDMPQLFHVLSSDISYI